MTREPSLNPPSEPLAAATPGPDPGLEQRLQAFFRREMPAHWPEIRAPEPTAASRPPPAKPLVDTGRTRVRPWSRSHLALAASVLLLVFAIGLLSNSLRGGLRGRDGAGEPTSERLNPDGTPIRPGPAKPAAKPVGLDLPMADYGFTD